MSRTIQIYSQFGDALLFKELHGVEGISSLYQYDLLLSGKDANLDIKSAIGSQLCVCIQTKEGERHLQGVVTDFGYDRPDVDEQGYHIYSCTLRPTLWHLTQTQNSRVFVEKTVIEIATTILSESGIEFDNKCQNQYRIYGQSTQYHESNFNYLSRLFEQEGIYYYFIQTKDKNILVLSDQNSQQDPILGNSHLIYHADVFAGTPDQAYLDTWQHKQHLNTTNVSLGDYNYQTKKSHLITDTPTHGLSAQSTERFEPYAQFKSLDEANHYKQIHKEHYQALTEEVIATGNVLTLCAGHHFTLQRHPHQKANIEYLITEVGFALKEAGYTTGDESGSYRTSLKAIPFSLQYRPKKQTPKPQVVGTQAAIITGPAGEEVYTNEYGDIKLQFHWDRYGPMNEKSSAWIRVIQASAGVNFGSVNVPRIGEEVLVDFINGDADRPVVVGRLYNVQNPPPWGYPAAAKKSGIKSKSFNSPVENFNEFMFDDTEGAELVNFQAQKDLTSLIKNDETRHVKNNRTTTVDVDETITVHGKRTETVDKDETITIHQNRTETVDKDETITIHQNRKERVDLDENISIGGNRTETVEGDEKIEVRGNRDKTVLKNDTLNVKQSQKHTIAKNKSLTVNQNNNEMVKVAKSVTVGTVYATQVGTVMNTAVGLMQAEEVGVSKKTMVGKSYDITAGDKFTLTVGSSLLTLNQDGTIILQGVDIQIIGSTKVDIIGKDVNINPEGVASVKPSNSNPATNNQPSTEPIEKSGFTKSQEKAIIDALSEQEKQLQATKTELERWNANDQARFQRAFGNHTGTDLEVARQQKLKELNKMIKLNEKMQEKPFKYFKPDPKPPIRVGNQGKMSDDPSIGAFVYPSDRTNKIYTGKAFFVDAYSKQPQINTQRANMITHEYSHFNSISKSYDYFDGKKQGHTIYNNAIPIYGQQASLALAQAEPKLALQHADSIAYYFSGITK